MSSAVAIVAADSRLAIKRTSLPCCCETGTASTQACSSGKLLLVTRRGFSQDVLRGIGVVDPRNDASLRLNLLELVVIMIVQLGRDGFTWHCMVVGVTGVDFLLDT